MQEPLERVTDKMIEAVGPKVLRRDRQSTGKPPERDRAQSGRPGSHRCAGEGSNGSGAGGLSPWTSVGVVQRRPGVRMRCSGRLGRFQRCVLRRLKAGTEGAPEKQRLIQRLRSAAREATEPSPFPIIIRRTRSRAGSVTQSQKQAMSGQQQWPHAACRRWSN